MGSFAIVGGLLLVGAIVLAFLGWRSARRVAAISAAETTSCAAIRAGLDPSGETIVELVGRAAPGSDGTIVAPLTRRRCVWHRSKLTRRYWEWSTSTDSRGQHRRRRVERNDVVYDQCSDTPFLLRDRTGHVVVDPADARVDKPTQVRNRFDRETGDLLVDLGLDILGRGNTIGFRKEEWVIVPDEALYVLGAAVLSDGRGDPVVTKPRTGHRELLISTRSERDLVRRGRWKTRFLYAGAVVAVVAGVGVFVAAVTR